MKTCSKMNLHRERAPHSKKTKIQLVFSAFIALNFIIYFINVVILVGMWKKSVMGGNLIVQMNTWFPGGVSLPMHRNFVTSSSSDPQISKS